MRSLLKIRKWWGLIPKPKNWTWEGEKYVALFEVSFLFPFLTHGDCFLGAELHIHKISSLA